MCSWQASWPSGCSSPSRVAGAPSFAPASVGYTARNGNHNMTKRKRGRAYPPEPEQVWLGLDAAQARQCSMSPLDPTYLPDGAPSPIDSGPKGPREHTADAAASSDCLRYSGCPTWHKPRYSINIHAETSNSKQKRRLTFLSSIFRPKCRFCLG